MDYEPIEYEVQSAAVRDGPPEPFADRLATLITRASNLSYRIPPRQRLAIKLFATGSTPQQIHSEHEISPATTNRAIDSAKGRQLLSIYNQIEELKGGPTLAQRRDLLWRIATTAELNAPNTAIRAADVLNRQAGDYQNAEDKDPNITIKINTFPTQTTPNSQPKDVTPVTPVLFND
tara:strand:- start:10959 stop:11489 length:531 start_codon:yes stop_codon:yes gene_type:complete